MFMWLLIKLLFLKEIFTIVYRALYRVKVVMAISWKKIVLTMKIKRHQVAKSKMLWQPVWYPKRLNNSLAESNELIIQKTILLRTLCITARIVMALMKVKLCWIIIRVMWKENWMVIIQITETVSTVNQLHWIMPPCKYIKFKVTDL